MQSSDSDKGAEKAAGIVCNVKTANCKSLSKNVKKMLRLRERWYPKYHSIQVLAWRHSSCQERGCWRWKEGSQWNMLERSRQQLWVWRWVHNQNQQSFVVSKHYYPKTWTGKEPQRGSCRTRGEAAAEVEGLWAGRGRGRGRGRGGAGGAGWRVGRVGWAQEARSWREMLCWRSRQLAHWHAGLQDGVRIKKNFACNSSDS